MNISQRGGTIAASIDPPPLPRTKTKQKQEDAMRPCLKTVLKTRVKLTQEDAGQGHNDASHYSDMFWAFNV